MEAISCPTTQKQQAAAPAPAMARAAVDCKAASAQIKRLAPAKVPTNCTLPILQSVHLENRAGALWARRTDLDVDASVMLAADAPDWQTPLCVNARAFSDAIAGKGSAKLELAGKVLIIRRENSATAALPLEPAEDYPLDPPVGNILCSVDADEFREAARNTAAAASTDETRQELCSVFFQPMLGALSLTGTNGHRLHRVQIRATGAIASDKADWSRLAPARFLAKLAAGKTLSGGEVRIYQTKPKDPGDKISMPGSRFLTFVQDGARFVCRMGEGPYPQIDRVIPKDPAARVETDSVALLSILKAAAAAADRQCGSREICDDPRGESGADLRGSGAWARTFGFLARGFQRRLFGRRLGHARAGTHSHSAREPHVRRDHPAGR
jgi:DNA polymerase III sliding clamp (beta) subunit (PCNA family)